MAFEAQWMNDSKHVMLVRYPADAWTWNEFYTFWDGTVIEMMDSAPGMVDIVQDFNQTDTPPNVIAELPKVNRVKILQHPQLKAIYMYNLVGMTKHAARIFSRVFYNLEECKNLDEALAHIRQGAG